MAAIETIRSRMVRLNGNKGDAATVRAVGIAAAILSLATRFDAMMARRRGRRALLELTDDQLKDIGVSRAEAHGEAARPFWD